MNEKVKCRAKNPATCRFHGTPVQENLNSNNTDTDDFDLFQSLLNKNPRIAAINQHVIWSNKKREELRNRYKFFHPNIQEEYNGIEYGSSVLTDYNESYELFFSQLTEEEAQALKHYTALGSIPINQHLRSPEFKQKNIDAATDDQRISKRVKEIELLDNAISKAEDKRKTVYRVLSQDNTEKFTSSEEYAEKNGFVPGKEVHFDNYSSTTIDPSFVNRFTGKDQEHTAVVLVISTTKGAPVAPTAVTRSEALYTQDTEREILLPRNITYKVTKVCRTRFNHTDPSEYDPIEPLTVYLEELPASN